MVFWKDQSLFEHYQEVLHDLPHISVRMRRREIGKELAQIAMRIAELPLSETFAKLWREGTVRIK